MEVSNPAIGGTKPSGPAALSQILSKDWSNKEVMNSTILIVALILLAVVWSKLLKPMLESKIKEMEREIKEQKSK